MGPSISVPSSNPPNREEFQYDSIYPDSVKVSQSTNNLMDSFTNASEANIDNSDLVSIDSVLTTGIGDSEISSDQVPTSITIGGDLTSDLRVDVEDYSHAITEYTPPVSEINFEQNKRSYSSLSRKKVAVSKDWSWPLTSRTFVDQNPIKSPFFPLPHSGVRRFQPNYLPSATKERSNAPGLGTAFDPIDMTLSPASSPASEKTILISDDESVDESPASSPNSHSNSTSLFSVSFENYNQSQKHSPNSESSSSLPWSKFIAPEDDCDQLPMGISTIDSKYRVYYSDLESSANAIPAHNEDPANVNYASLCETGRKTVLEIVNEFTILFQHLKDFQLYVHDKVGLDENKKQAIKYIQRIQELFITLKWAFETVESYCSSLTPANLESLIPMVDEPNSLENPKASESLRQLEEERRQIIEEIFQKNGQLKDFIDLNNSIIWEINSMLAKT